MALQSFLTSSTHSHTSATGVLSSQTNPSQHTFLYTSAKVTGVFLLIILCALIVMSAQASSKQANAAFEAADGSGRLNLQLDTSNSADTASTTGASSGDSSATLESSQTSTDNGGTSMDVNINGETVTVPAGGSYSKVIDDANGRTTVEVNSSTQGDATNRSRTTTKVNMSSTSTSSSDVSTKIKITGDGN